MILTRREHVIQAISVANGLSRSARAAGKCAQEDQSTSNRFVRSILCGVLFTQEWLPVAHVAEGISEVAHGTFVLCYLERAGRWSEPARAGT